MSTNLKNIYLTNKKNVIIKRGLNKVVINMLLECFSNHW